MIDKTCRHSSYCVGDECRCEAYRHMTNADRIRSMTDEELAKFIYEQADCFCVARYGVCIKDEDTCRAAWLKWLKEEVEHDRTDEAN